MCADKELKIRFSTFGETNLDGILSGGSLFGWGQSTYDAGNSVVTLRFLSSEREIPYYDLPAEPQASLFSPIHTHEIAHHMLASSTRIGITLRHLSALSDGLALIAANEMLRHTGKVWIPFKTYLESEAPDPHLGQLARAVYGLESLRNNLTEGWRITHELFALCCSLTFGMLKESVLDGLDLSEEEAVRILAVITDESLVSRVVEKLCKVLGRKTLFEDRTPKPADWQMLASLAESKFQGAEKSEALAVLGASQLVFSKYFGTDGRESDTDRDVKSAFRSLIEATAAAYTEGRPEHQAACKLFQRFRHDPEDMTKIMMIIGGLSNLYAPELSPSKVMQGERCMAQIKGVDRVLSPALDRLMRRSISEITRDIKQTLDEICHIQKMLNSVTLKSLSNFNVGHILGSPEWFEKFYNELHLNRRQKNVLRGLLAGSQIENGEWLPMLSAHGGRIIPRIARPLFHLFLACKRWIIRFFPQAAKAYEGLKNLGMSQFRAVKNAVSLYYPLLASLGSLDASSWHAPTISVCYNPRGGVLLALGAQKDDLPVRYVAIRSVLDALRHALVRPAEKQPVIFCPLGAVGGVSNLCFRPAGPCVVRKLSHLFMEGSLLVCCKRDPAKLLRLERHPNNWVEAGKIHLTVQECPQTKHEIEKDGGNRTKENGPERKKLHKNNSENQKSPQVRRFTKILGTIIGKTAVTIITAPFTLWLVGLKWRRYRINRRTKRSLSDISLVLNNLGYPPTETKASEVKAMA